MPDLAPPPAADAPLSMAQYEAMVANMTPPTPEEAAAASAILETQASAPVIAAPPPVEPEAPAAPEAAAAPPAEQPAEQQSEESAQPPAEQEPQAGLANNWRLDAGGDPVTQLAFQIYKQHQGGERLALSVCEAMARQQLGLQPIAAPQPVEQPAESQPEATAPDAATGAIADLEAQDAALRAELKEAVDAFDTEKQFEINEKRDALRVQIVTEKLRAEQTSKAHETALAESRAAVSAQFGDQYKPGSPLTLMMVGLFDSWQSSNDPRMNSPRLPELLAQEAAGKLGIKPTTEQTAAAAATAAAAVQPSSAPQAPPRSTPPVAPPIAPGSARSQDPGPITPPNFNSKGEYDAWVQTHLGVSPL